MCSLQVLCMRVSGSMAKGMAKAPRHGRMVQSTQVNGKTTRLRARENSPMLTGMFMMANGPMTRPMDTVFIFTRMEPSTKDFGKMTCSTASDQKLGKIAVDTRAITATAASMALASTNGTMAPFSRETGRKTRFSVQASTNGWTADHTRANGVRITWKAWAFTAGKMVEFTTGSTKTIRNMVTEFTSGKTIENTRDTGATASSMAWGYTR